MRDFKTLLNCDSKTLEMLQKCFLLPVFLLPHSWGRHNLIQYSEELIRKAITDELIVMCGDWYFVNPSIYNKYNKTLKPNLIKLETIND